MATRTIARGIGALLAGLLCAVGGVAEAAASDAPSPVPKAFDPFVGNAASIGNGPLVAWQTKDQTLLAIPVELLDRL